MSGASAGNDAPVKVEPFPVAPDSVGIRREEGVVFAEIAAPPIISWGPELVDDLVWLIHNRAETDDTLRVLVPSRADATISA